VFPKSINRAQRRLLSRACLKGESKTKQLVLLSRRIADPQRVAHPRQAVSVFYRIALSGNTVELPRGQPEMVRGALKVPQPACLEQI
jgi:hypothetical protein